METLAHTTAIILAGGKSSRMGQDKGLMLLDGKPMIQYIIDTVQPIANNIIIIANNKAYEKFGFPVYGDLVKDKGPVGGIVTGLSASTTDLNWVISCDTPFVSQELLEMLMLNMDQFDAVIPTYENRTHPLIACYNKSALPVFKKALHLNELKIMTLISKLHAKIMNANQFDVLNFKNLNSKEDI
ncbi:MAG: NTP transferase domain-containing protein [Crocinitomix sp.]|nr:NTP transferase domain-containing protein [Crocinitomix sp.]